MPFLVEISEVIGKEVGMPLSEIAESIKYVPLESKPECMLGDVRKVIVCDSSIYVSDYEKLLKFSLEGKFEKQIGRMGRGPGEYISVGNYGINKDSGIILIFDDNSLNKLMYDTDGNFIQNDNTRVNGSEFVFLGKDKIAIHTSESLAMLDSMVESLKFFDYNFNPVFEIPGEIQPEQIWKIGNVPLYIFDKKLYYKKNFNDTLYFFNDNKLNPYAILKLGEHQIPPNFSIPINKGIKEGFKMVENKLRVHELIESENYLFIQLLFGLGRISQNSLFIIFDKSMNRTKAIKDKGFKNDIDYGVSIWPKFIFNDNVFIDVINAYEFKTEILKLNSQEISSQNRSKFNYIEKLANSLDENDNPVLMLVKLKE